MSAGLLLEQVISGLVLGSMYALLGSGLALIYGTMRVLNFGHGEMFMLGGFSSALLIAWAGLPPLVAVPIGILLVTAFAGLVHRVALRPLLGAKDVMFSAIAMTLGLSITLQNAALLIWGERTRPVPYYVEGIVQVGELRYPWMRLLIFAVSMGTLIAVAYALAKTRLGWAIRATSQDVEAAKAVGIDTRRTHLITFACSAGLGALAGAMLAPIMSVGPFMGVPMLLKAFVVIVLGGLGSFAGAIIGGLALGVIEALGITLTSAAWRDVIAFVVLIAMIWIRPWGLLGKKPREG